jgi:anti-sigma factor RsiW
MDTDHVQPLISDYVLGLASAEERRQVERHSLACAACASALERERRLASMVRQTAQAATLPASRLAQLRPALPRRFSAPHKRLSRQLAPAMMILVLLCASLGVQATGAGARGGAGNLLGLNAGTPTLVPSDTPTATAIASTLLALESNVPLPVASGDLVPEVSPALAPIPAAETGIPVTPVPHMAAP